MEIGFTQHLPHGTDRMSTEGYGVPRNPVLAYPMRHIEGMPFGWTCQTATILIVPTVQPFFIITSLACQEHFAQGLLGVSCGSEDQGCEVDSLVHHVPSVPGTYLLFVPQYPPSVQWASQIFVMPNLRGNHCGKWLEPHLRLTDCLWFGVMARRKCLGC